MLKDTTEPAQNLGRLANQHFRRWLGGMLKSVGGNPNGLGSELVETNVAGVTKRDVADYDEMLRSAEVLGWIERTVFSPSISQQAFGCFTYGDISKASADAKKLHATWFMWRIASGAEEDVRRFVGDDLPKPTAFHVGDKVRYSEEFLRLIGGGRSMSELRGLRGTVVAIGGDDAHPNDSFARYPRILWEGDTESHLVHPGNLRKVERSNKLPPHMSYYTT